MAWLESHQEVRDHPKTRRLARELGIHRMQAIGHLHGLWWWALDYAPDGDLSRFEDQDIADACDWDGDAGQLVQALRTHGWLDGQQLHDWDKYGGKYVKRRDIKRVRDRERVNARRARSRRAVIARDGLVCGICGGVVAIEDVELDHVLPFSMGGPTTVENLRVTHSRCNRIRGNRI